eukprot:jgi/Mesvir1/26515/Mv16172-RA.1
MLCSPSCKETYSSNNSLPRMKHLWVAVGISLLLVHMQISVTSGMPEVKSPEECEADHLDRLEDFKRWLGSHHVSVQEKHKRLEQLLEEMLLCYQHEAEKSNKKIECELGENGRLLNINENILLVGNGASVTQHHNGHLIDQFDEVMRFNNIRVRGFENIVGRKTTIAFIGSVYEICPCSEQHKRLGIKSVECCDDDMAEKFWSNFDNTQDLKVISASSRIPAFLFTAPSAPLGVRTMRNVYRFQPWPLGKLANKVLDKLQKYEKGIKARFNSKTVLRNGMYCIILLIECGIRPTLAGFDINYDPNQGYVHHYYPLDNEPVQKFTGRGAIAAAKEHEKGYHDFDVEGQVLRELLAANVIMQMDASKGNDEEEQQQEEEEEPDIPTEDNEEDVLGEEESRDSVVEETSDGDSFGFGARRHMIDNYNNFR